MKESIYTIPLTDIFKKEANDGCPVCRMREMLENRCIEYIMGAAMMEPDIRMETNKYGFCASHLERMMHQKNRLSLALMLETHLDELMAQHMPPAAKKKGEESPAHTCFVCREIDRVSEKFLQNAARTAAADPVFLELVCDQEYYCFAHYDLFCRIIADTLPKKQAKPLIEALTQRTKAYLQTLRDDVHSFTLMFDYRSKGQNENERTKQAVANAVSYLSK